FVGFGCFLYELTVFRGRQSVHHVLDGIDRFSIEMHLIMEVRGCGSSGITYEADHFSFLDLLSFFHHDFVQMGVSRDISVSMIYRYIETITGGFIFDLLDYAVSCSLYFGRLMGCEFYAFVAIGYFLVRVDSYPKNRNIYDFQD